MITKAEAAERQLNTAIRLFFENRDHLSSYALAFASREVTDAVIKSQRPEIYERELARVGDPLKVRLSYWEEMTEVLIDKDKFAKICKGNFDKNFKTLHNKWQNFFKHADKDPAGQIESFTAKQVALVIMLAIKNYILLTERWTTEMATFFVWFTLAEPQLVESAPVDVMTNKAIADMRSYISGDPYDRNSLEIIYTALRPQY